MYYHRQLEGKILKSANEFVPDIEILKQKQSKLIPLFAVGQMREY